MDDVTGADGQCAGDGGELLSELNVIVNGFVGID